MRVIYETECITRSAQCVSETGRTLSVRMKKHLASERRKSLILPLDELKVKAHGRGDFEVGCTILTYERRTSAKKAL